MELAPDDSAAPEIIVDLSGLSEFARELRHEVEINLRPFLVDLIQSYSLGVNVGNGMGTPNMLAARRQYQACLTAMIDQLNTIAQAGTVLANAAVSVGDRYRGVDALSSITVDVVDQAFGTAGSSDSATAESDTKIRRAI